MNFQEKSAWACIGSLVLVFVPYFAVVFLQPMAFVGLFILAIIGLIGLLGGFHLVNALSTRSIRTTGDAPGTDEMDHGIELRAAKVSGIALGTIVLIWSICAMFGTPALAIAEITTNDTAGDAESLSDFAIPVSLALLWVHILFSGFVFANLIYYGQIAVSYRRLARG